MHNCLKKWIFWPFSPLFHNFYYQTQLVQISIDLVLYFPQETALFKDPLYTKIFLLHLPIFFKENRCEESLRTWFTSIFLLDHEEQSWHGTLGRLYEAHLFLLGILTFKDSTNNSHETFNQ